MPVIASWREFTASGALLSYGPSRIFEAKRLAGYVPKVLSGAMQALTPRPQSPAAQPQAQQQQQPQPDDKKEE